MKHQMMIMTLVTVLSFCGCKDDPRSTLIATPPQTTTIPLSFVWDVESNTFSGLNSPTADFFWSGISETEKRLITQEGVKAAIAKGKSFDDVSANYILGKSLEPISIEQSVKEQELEPGTVVVFQTVEGNLGKLVVERYRSLHDLEFPEASNFTDDWKAAAKERNDAPECHIEIKWSLFK